VIAFFVIRSQQSDDDDPRYHANPNIKLPPPSNPVVVPPPIPIDAAEPLADQEIEVVEDEVATEPGTIVKLRETKKTKKKIRKRRPPRETPKPPPDEPTDGTWDPTTLFPDKVNP
jgi:hypothetical protein